MDERSRLCSVWLGSETGILKGVSLSRRQAFNFCNMSHLSREQEVRVMCWADPAESELHVGSVDGTVKTFSTEKGIFTETKRCGEAAEGCFTGLAALDVSVFVTCTETGALRVWREESDVAVKEIDAGKNVCRMRQNTACRQRVAAGGKENGLKIWDLENPEKPVFAAKNLRDDWLSLRQPEWVRDMAFIPDSEKVVTCTGHHQVRVYDPSSPQRRPVMETKFGEYPLIALSLPASGNLVVVGNTHGDIAMLDLRKGLVRGCLKGLAGGVRSLQCHASLPMVASCGLDRFLRIHSLEDRKLLHKVYLKSRLNCLLLSSRDPQEVGKMSQNTEEGEGLKAEDDDEAEVWDNMEKVEDEEDEAEEEERPKKRKTDREGGPHKKSKRKSVKT